MRRETEAQKGHKWSGHILTGHSEHWPHTAPALQGRIWRRWQLTSIVYNFTSTVKGSKTKLEKRGGARWLRIILKLHDCQRHPGITNLILKRQVCFSPFGYQTVETRDPPTPKWEYPQEFRSERRRLGAWGQTEDKLVSQKKSSHTSNKWSHRRWDLRWGMVNDTQDHISTRTLFKPNPVVKMPEDELETECHRSPPSVPVPNILL